MVGVYEFIVPKGTTDVEAVAVGMMDLIYSKLDGNILDGLNKQVPSWVSIGADETSLYVINFTFNGTEYCIVATINTSNSVSIKMFYKTIRVKNNYNIVSFSSASFGTSNSIYKFMIGVDLDYFLLSEIVKNSNIQFLTIKVDIPTNTSDTNVFISLFPYDNNSYNKPFSTEDISLINPVLISDSGSTSSLYSSSFQKNFYNQKMPVYNIYAFNSVYGIRGKISRLVMLPISIAEVGKFYTLNSVEYICISRYYFNNIGGSVLLRY